MHQGNVQEKLRMHHLVSAPCTVPCACTRGSGLMILILQRGIPCLHPYCKATLECDRLLSAGLQKYQHLDGVLYQHQ